MWQSGAMERILRIFNVFLGYDVIVKCSRNSLNIFEIVCHNFFYRQNNNLLLSVFFFITLKRLSRHFYFIFKYIVNFQSYTTFSRFFFAKASGVAIYFQAWPLNRLKVSLWRLCSITKTFSYFPLF